MMFFVTLTQNEFQSNVWPPTIFTRWHPNLRMFKCVSTSFKSTCLASYNITRYRQHCHLYVIVHGPFITVLSTFPLPSFQVLLSGSYLFLIRYRSQLLRGYSNFILFKSNHWSLPPILFLSLSYQISSMAWYFILFLHGTRLQTRRSDKDFERTSIRRKWSQLSIWIPNGHC